MLAIFCFDLLQISYQKEWFCENLYLFDSQTVIKRFRITRLTKRFGLCVHNVGRCLTNEHLNATIEIKRSCNKYSLAHFPLDLELCKFYNILMVKWILHL